MIYSKMKLGIVSDAHHYYNSQGQLCTISTLTQQFGQWANLFEEVYICAPLILGEPPSTHSPYRSPNVELFPIKVAGGNNIKAKINLLAKTGSWCKVLSSLLNLVDAVHIRCPNNISIPGLALLSLTRLPRHAIYTGNWLGYPGEPKTYQAQRIYLKRYFHGPVAVYGDWHCQPNHVIPSYSPSYSVSDWEEEISLVKTKEENLSEKGVLYRPIELLTVGALNDNKNQQLVIRVLQELIKLRIPAILHIVGDGQKREMLQQLSKNLAINEKVHFYGTLPNQKVRELYRKADFVIQPSFTEGFSKVPLEAMFHGTIPLLSNISTNPQIIGTNERGRCYNPTDYLKVVEHIIDLANRPTHMIRTIEDMRQYAYNHTLEAWRSHIHTTLDNHWQETRIQQSGLYG